MFVFFACIIHVRLLGKLVDASLYPLKSFCLHLQNLASAQPRVYLMRRLQGAAHPGGADLPYPSLVRARGVHLHAGARAHEPTSEQGRP
eukprot:1878273-Pleurochrysis_carterae.AAC.1